MTILRVHSTGRRGRRSRATCTSRFFFFFFSSRRRHTRCSRDWSSDVCSSDLTLKLVRARAAEEHVAVYLYAMHGLLNLFVGALCQWLRFPLVQEMCEWWPAEPRCSALTRWLFRKRMFRASTGLLVISKAIEGWAHERAAKINPRLAIYRLPSVVDLDR